MSAGVTEMDAMEQPPVSLRTVYPGVLPRNYSRLVERANEGNDDAIDALQGMFSDSSQFDPWHAKVLRGIFGTHHRVTDRNGTAVKAIRALDVIKARVQPGTPFLYSGSGIYPVFELAGKLDDEPMDFEKYPGLTLKLSGMQVDGTSGDVPGFPDFTIGRKGTRFSFVPQSYLAEGAWDYLTRVAEGMSSLALGEDHIVKSLETKPETQSFYAALALRLAGIDIDVQLKEGAKQAATEAITEALTYSVAGLSAPDKVEEVKRDNHYPYGHSHTRLREHSLQDLTRGEGLAVLDVLGFTRESVVGAIHSGLEQIVVADESSLLQVAAADAGRTSVERFVSVLYGPNI